MPVQTPHPDYLYRKPDWQKVRDFAEGARCVRAANETYLPKMKGWKDEDYAAYKQRAEVYGAVDRTIDGLDGAIFRKAPKIELPGEADEALMKDVTLTGKTLTEFIRDVCRDVLTVGRGGVLVEFSGGSAQQQSNAPTHTASEERPYLVFYSAEQIINWDTETIGGVTKLTLLVLEENSWGRDERDPFLAARKIRYRVLRLVGGIYQVEIWTATAQQSTQATGIPGSTPAKTSDVQYEKTDAFIPQRRGSPLTSIPFFFYGVSGQSITPEKPPLLDVADLCVLHYMTSADYAHGLHWVGLPTPWGTGLNDTEKGNMAIGPATMLLASASEAKFGMLEFTGQGLTAVKDRLEGLERKMAALGARILEEQKKQSESGEALKLRQSGDASVLAGISDAISRTTEAVVSRLLWWAGTATDAPEVTVELNMEFFGQAIDPQLLIAMMQAQQAGLMTKATFVWNLMKGEMLPEGRTVEDELAKLETEAPQGMAPAPVDGRKGGTK